MWFLLVHAWKKRGGKKPAPKRFSRVKGAVRAAAFLGTTLTVVSLLSARHAQAEMARAGMRLGSDLMPLVHERGDASTVSLNGQKIMMTYHGAETPVSEVLDKAEEACRAGGVKAPHVETAPPKGDPLLKIADFGVMRTGDDRAGLVLCFAKGSMTKESLTEQLQELEKTGDLGSLGKMRYVYARRENNQTAVLAAITEDSFDLKAMDPSREGDAPNTDDGGLPRPRNSVRFLQAQIDGTPYAVRGYRTRASEAEAHADVDKGMAERGFKSVEVELKDGTKATGYLKDGVVVTLSVGKDKSGETLVSLGSLGADDRPRVR